MDGTREVRVGPVVLRCMSAEARDLMDRALAGYAAFKSVSEDRLVGNHVGDPSVCSFAYWLFRYSGLVRGVEDGSDA